MSTARESYKTGEDKIKVINERYAHSLRELAKDYMELVKPIREQMMNDMFQMSLRELIEYKLDIQLGLAELLAVGPQSAKLIGDIIPPHMRQKLIENSMDPSIIAVTILQELAGKSFEAARDAMEKRPGTEKSDIPGGNMYGMKFKDEAEMRTFLKTEFNATDDEIDAALKK